MSAQELLPCPFCGGAAHLSTIGRSWYRITADHADSCFLEDRETDCPQTNEQLQLLLRDWNTRSSYTAVDMANAARDGFRDGAASVVVELPKRVYIDSDGYRDCDWFKSYNVIDAIIAAGGRVKDE